MKVNPERARRYLSRTQPRRMVLSHRDLSDSEAAEQSARRWLDLVGITHPNVEVFVWEDRARLGARVVEWEPR